MRLIIEYSALAVAVWLSFDVLFVIAWVRFHSARQHFEDQIKATVIAFRPNDRDVRTEAAHHDQLTGDLVELSFKKTS